MSGTGAAGVRGAEGPGSDPAQGPAGDRVPMRVLVVCTGNSARSILGEALFRHLGGDRVEVRSAGTEPKGVHPLTLRVLEEAGIPTSGLRSDGVTAYLDQPWDWVITVCDTARDTCPYVPGARARRHWSLADPAAVAGTEDERLDAFRAIMGQLDARIRHFLAETGVVPGLDRGVAG